MVKSSGSSLAAYEGGAQPELADVQAMMKLNEELVAAGEIFDIGDRPDDLKAVALEFAEKLGNSVAK
jgi:hypothetical protein